MGVGCGGAVLGFVFGWNGWVIWVVLIIVRDPKKKKIYMVCCKLEIEM